MILLAASCLTTGCQTTYKNQDNFLINNSRDPIREISYLLATQEEVTLEIKMEDGSFESTTYHKYLLEVVTQTGERIPGYAVSLEDFSRENVFDEKTTPESLTFFIITVQTDGGKNEEILEITKTR